ncbi:hypothetical protein JXJ21_20060 [candidate division KSB1 bacterium]|nr:hypothetical protein [candidate division KSB1 bacterium]
MSNKTTLNPLCANRSAADAPEGPLPTIATSTAGETDGVISLCTNVLSELISTLSENDAADLQKKNPLHIRSLFRCTAACCLGAD